MYIDSRSHYLGKEDMEYIDTVRNELYVPKSRCFQIALFISPKSHVPCSYEALNTIFRSILYQNPREISA